MASPVPRGSPTGRGATLDGAVALLVAASVLTVYVRTLLPHLGGTEDTPKFQYLGYVLGTAHHPGYPLYVMVSHLFSYLPIGTLAYRINLMSACFWRARGGADLPDPPSLQSPSGNLCSRRARIRLRPVLLVERRHRRGLHARRGTCGGRGLEAPSLERVPP